MSADGRRHILATSGGFARDPAGRLRPAALFDHALALTGRERPRVCLLATAQGDAPAALAALYGALAERDLRPSHLALHPMPSVDDPRRHLLQQDLIWVDGGSVANLLAVWRVHRLDAALREAWDAGVVLAGVSAGALCWFQAGTTDSFGPELRAVHDGLGFLAPTTTRSCGDDRPTRGWSRPGRSRPGGPPTMASGSTSSTSRCRRR